MCIYLAQNHYKVDSTDCQEVCVQLTADETNVIRYVGGYVALKLLQKYEKKAGNVASWYVHCLGEMPVEGEGEDVLMYTRKWLEQVNRGGLYPINDEAFSFFVELKACICSILPRYLTTPNSDKEKFQEKIHDKVIMNENVQFYWTLLSQDIHAPEDAENLLTEIIHLRIYTIRGFAIAASWMEVLKVMRKGTHRSPQDYVNQSVEYLIKL